MNIRNAAGFFGVAMLLLTASSVGAQATDPSWDILGCIEKHSDKKATFAVSERKRGTIVRFHRSMKLSGPEKTAIIGCISKKYPDLVYK